MTVAGRGGGAYPPGGQVWRGKGTMTLRCGIVRKNYLAGGRRAAGLRDCESLYDNVFAWIEDLPQAQCLCNRFSQLNWPRILNGCANRVVPQLDDVLYGCQCY